MNKGILIDMGDTLIHTNNMDFRKSFNYMYDLSKTCDCEKDYFLEYSYKVFKDIFYSRKYLEAKLIDFIRLLIETFNLSYDISLEELEVKFAFESCNITKVNNVKEVLEHFKSKNYKIVVLSNTCFSRKAIVAMLDDLNQYFDEVIASSEFMVRKPYEAFFELGISKFDISRDNIYYIGNDYYFDIYGSSRANLKSVWLNENNKEKNNNLKVSNYIEINDFIQLIEMDF